LVPTGELCDGAINDFFWMNSVFLGRCPIVGIPIAFGIDDDGIAADGVVEGRAAAFARAAAKSRGSASPPRQAPSTHATKSNDTRDIRPRSGC
jgi:hypothetical protein